MRRSSLLALLTLTILAACGGGDDAPAASESSTSTETTAEVDDLVADLEAAGAPDTETGEDTAEELVTGIEDVRELFVGARDDTEALPTDDPTALGSGLQDIGAALQDSATAVGAQFEEVLSSVDDPELGAAFEDAAACRDLATLS